VKLRPSFLMDLKDISQWLSIGKPTQTPLVMLFSQYLNAEGAAQIFSKETTTLTLQPVF